ncbi:MAG: PBSX family phage terminase large subunit [Tissierellia bacterium]|nr:PBSX family phage terminase large subunit [Tissierellia bacterium]
MEIKIQANPVFKEVNHSSKRYIVMKGSAGSGKSVDTAQNYILRLLKDKGRNLVCVRKSDITNRDSTYAELSGAIYRMFGDKADKYFKVIQSPLKIECRANGNQIIFRGMNDERQREKLKSITFKKGKLTDVWIEEATELTQADFEIIDDRLRGQLPEGQFYQIRLTFNPVSKTHWIKKTFFDFDDKNVLTHHSTYLTNRFIDEAYKERMLRRKEIDPDGYRIYGLGDWGEVGGLILSNWQVKDISQNLNDYDDVALGQDFGLILIAHLCGDTYLQHGELLSRCS